MNRDEVGAPAIDHARLMRASDCIEAAARFGTAQQQLVARRLIEDAGARQALEREHDGLMRVASFPEQAIRALNDLLRSSSACHCSNHDNRRLRGGARWRALAQFHGPRAYTDDAAEHGNFVARPAAIVLAPHRHGRDADGAFEPMARYVDLFREYFHAFGDVSLGGDDTESLRALLPTSSTRLPNCAARFSPAAPCQTVMARSAADRRHDADAPAALAAARSRRARRPRMMRNNPGADEHMRHIRTELPGPRARALIALLRTSLDEALRGSGA